VVAGANGKGNRLDQLDHPHCVFVDHDHSVYMSDKNKHRVMTWEDDAKQGTAFTGSQGPGNSLSKLNFF
ncbi:unnamed protein product, partial [Rotaria socialis]